MGIFLVTAVIGNLEFEWAGRWEVGSISRGINELVCV